MTRNRPPLKDIMRLTGLSRATIDRALNARDGVRPATLAAIEAAVASLQQAEASGTPAVTRTSSRPKNFKFVIQADDEFTQSIIEQTAILGPVFAAKGCQLEVIPFSNRGADLVAPVIAEQALSDGVAILVENSFAVSRVTSALKARGVPVVATNTDIDLAARHAFVGIDNRAAGQTAGFMMGRHLCNQPSANVAVVVETLSFRCHEEREMGFRAVIRQRFPSINIIDVVRWDSSRHGTYESAKSLLKDWPEIDGIYNTSGGNHGLAQALEESGRLGKTLFIAHEINPVTEPLVRADALDYLITQNLKALLTGTVDELLLVATGGQPSPNRMLRPELLCKYTLPLWVE